MRLKCLSSILVQKLAARLMMPILLTVLIVNFASAAIYDRTVPTPSQAMNMQTTAPTGLIIIKFTDESRLLVSETGLLGEDTETVRRVSSLMAEHSFRGQLQRRFPSSMEEIDAQRRSGEKRVKHALPNLNRYGVLDLRHQSDNQTQLLRVLKEILADPAVETAFLEPRSVPAALGFDAFTGTYQAPTIPSDFNTDAPSKTSGDFRSNTPDYSASQGYLGEPDSGINAWAVADIPGARGTGMQIVDVEGAWLWDHEDLSTPFYTAGGVFPDLSWRDHGTAVLGVISGMDNGYGVRGITPDVSIGGVSIMALPVSAAINTAWQAVEVGDVIVIELHAPGPAASGEGQDGYVPEEFWQDNFDAILIATANGRIVCEAAGNGAENLEDPVYGTLFDRTVRDSGAILCGAANRFGEPEWFTNYGSRVDLHGWGSLVVTCAYGDLQGEPDNPETEFYTSVFSGTSSATPIVTGAVLALQGMVKFDSTDILDPILLRELLTQTGTPAGGIKHVGPLPDILAAWTDPQLGFGTITGTVTDAVSGLPVAGAVIQPQDISYEIVTDEMGAFSFGCLAGPGVLDISSYFHDGLNMNILVVGGEDNTIDIQLTPVPTMTVVGHIFSQVNGDLNGVRATVLGAPLVPGETSPDGVFNIEGVPENRCIRILVDNAPLHGADVVSVLSVPDALNERHVFFQLAQVENTFEFWGEGFVDYTATWTWGTPVGGPASGFSGEKCWGMGMAGTGYPDNTAASLEGPSLNLYGSQQALLSFHYWSEIEAGMDGVKLQLLHNSIWIDVEPETDYDYDRIIALNAAPGWSGNSDGWRGAVFDLLPYVDNYINFRFFFSSDNSVSDGGFYVDDITLDMGDHVSAVPMQSEIPLVFAPRLSVYPNPFNPQTEIAWEISRVGTLKIDVYDARGLLVRRLHDGVVTSVRGTQLFDGRNDNGGQLASGMYLVRVSDGSGREMVSRMSLVK